MSKSRLKMEGQLSEDFSNLMEELTAIADETIGIDAVLEKVNMSWQDYEDVKEYLYDKYKVVTFI